MMGAGESRRAALEENLTRIENEIATACRQAGRSRSEVALMAVSKQHPAQAIADAVSLGLTLFGENRVQEFQDKQALLTGMEIGDRKPHFHLIGQLQSNKSTRAAELFDSIDTLDSLRLAERLHQAALDLKRRLPVLIEIKISHEASKTGLVPDSPELHSLLERLPDWNALDLRGLMTVPPYEDDLETVRPHFARLRVLREQLAAAYPRLNLAELSMGMSHDFSVAIEEGSTQVRIGTRLFGARPRPQA